MVQAIQVLRFHLLELEKVSVLYFILVILHIGIVCSPEGRQVQQDCSRVPKVAGESFLRKAPLLILSRALHVCLTRRN